MPQPSSTCNGGRCGIRRLSEAVVRLAVHLAVCFVVLVANPGLALAAMLAPAGSEAVTVLKCSVAVWAVSTDGYCSEVCHLRLRADYCHHLAESLRPDVHFPAFLDYHRLAVHCPALSRAAGMVG
jgi:hypothetical protein